MAMGIELGQDPNKEEKVKRLWDRIENPTRQVAGLGGEVATGLALDAKTAWMLNPLFGWVGYAGYGVTNFAGGAISNIAAQKLRQEEEINWGEAISSGVLGIVPGTSIRFARGLSPGKTVLANRAFGKSGSVHRAVTGGAVTGVADQTIQSYWNEQELPSATDVAAGAIAGGTLGGAFSTLGKLYTKYRGRSPKEINTSLTKKERSALSPLEKRLFKAHVESLESGDKTKVLEIVEEINEAKFNFEKNKGLHPGIMDYNHYKKTHKLSKLHIKDSIDGRDPFMDPSGFSADEIIKRDKWLANYATQEASNNTVRALLGRMKASKAWSPRQLQKAMREVSGFIHVEDVVHETETGRRIEPGLISIAKLVNAELKQAIRKGNVKAADVRLLNIDDVYKYLKEQVEGDKLLVKEITELNAWHREPSIKEIKAKIEELRKSGRFSNRTFKRLLRALREVNKQREYEKGHKESLHQMFLKYTTGGNRLSNMYIQAKGNKTIMNILGELIEVKGNTSLSDKDLPLYTLTKLKGSRKNLKEDFIKSVMPKAFPDDSIHEPYWEAAEILYRNGMDTVADLIPKDQDYHANLAAYSMAVTNGIYEMIMTAEALDIGADLFEDRFILKIKGLHKGHAELLKNTRMEAFKETLKNLNVTNYLK